MPPPSVSSARVNQKATQANRSTGAAPGDLVRLTAGGAPSAVAMSHGLEATTGTGSILKELGEKPTKVTRDEAAELDAEIADLKAELKGEKKAQERAEEGLDTTRNNLNSAQNEIDMEKYKGVMASYEKSVERHTQNIAVLNSQITVLTEKRDRLSGVPFNFNAFEAFLQEQRWRRGNTTVTAQPTAASFETGWGVLERKRAFQEVLNALNTQRDPSVCAGRRSPIPIILGPPGSGKSLILSIIACKGHVNGCFVSDFTDALDEMPPEFKQWYDSLAFVTFTLNDRSQLDTQEQSICSAVAVRLLWSFCRPMAGERDVPFDVFGVVFGRVFGPLQLDEVIVELKRIVEPKILAIVGDEIARADSPVIGRSSQLMSVLSAASVPVVVSSLSMAITAKWQSDSGRGMQCIAVSALSATASDNIIDWSVKYLEDKGSDLSFETFRAVGRAGCGHPRVFEVLLKLAEREKKILDFSTWMFNVMSTLKMSLPGLIDAEMAADAAVLAYLWPRLVDTGSLFKRVWELVAKGYLSILEVERHAGMVTPVLPPMYAYWFQQASVRSGALQKVLHHACTFGTQLLHPQGIAWEDTWCHLLALSLSLEVAAAESKERLQLNFSSSFQSLLCGHVFPCGPTTGPFVQELIRQKVTLKTQFASNGPLTPNELYSSLYQIPGFDLALTRTGTDGRQYVMAMECKSGKTKDLGNAKRCAQKLSLLINTHQAFHSYIAGGCFVFCMVILIQDCTKPELKDVADELIEKIDLDAPGVNNLWEALKARFDCHDDDEKLTLSLVEEVFVYVDKAQLLHMSGPSLCYILDGGILRETELAPVEENQSFQVKNTPKKKKKAKTNDPQGSGQ